MVGKNRRPLFLGFGVLFLAVGLAGLVLLKGNSQAEASPYGGSENAPAGDIPVPGAPPALSGGSWVPAEITWTPPCDTTPCTALTWYVCDEDNDLAGGVAFLVEDEISDILLYREVPWADLTITGDVTNCGDPAEVVYPFLIPVEYFETGPGDYHFVLDIGGNDATGGVSSFLEDIGLLIHFTLSTTTTTTIGTIVTTTVISTTTTQNVPPQLWGGVWMPEIVDWTLACETVPCAELNFFACDEDNDLVLGVDSLPATRTTTSCLAWIPGTYLFTRPGRRIFSSASRFPGPTLGFRRT